MKCGLVTIVILVVINISLLSAVLANSNTKTTSEKIDTPESLNLTSALKGNCNLSMNGNVNKSLMLTKTGERRKAIEVVGSGPCQVRILQVGGGGYNSWSGGGSGFLEYNYLKIK